MRNASENMKREGSKKKCIELNDKQTSEKNIL